jgi:serine/threonine-protein kinase
MTANTPSGDFPSERTKQPPAQAAAPVPPAESADLDLELTIRAAPPARPESPSPNPAESSLLIGHVLDGRLIVTKKLGQGAMGAVYRVIDQDTQVEYAAKVLAPALASDPQALLELKQEVARAAPLTHQNLLNIKYFCDYGPQTYIVMENIDGENLEALRLRRGGTVSPAELAHLAPQILSGLDYLHDRGLVHRDVKPQNIMVTTAGEVKIADYGIARSIKEQLTQAERSTQVSSGTLSYMAPEQMRPGDVCDRRTDVYAVGMLFYHLLTGHYPFDATVQQEIVRWHLDSAHKIDALPYPTWAGIVRRALEVDPARRWPSCKAMAEALGECGRGAASTRSDNLHADREAAMLVCAGCGVTWDAGAAKCSACGWTSKRSEHTGEDPVRRVMAALEAVSREQRKGLAARLQKLQDARHAEASIRSSILGSINILSAKRRTAADIAEQHAAVIASFPAPKDQASLMTLFLFADASANSVPENGGFESGAARRVRDAWRAKARALFLELEQLGAGDTAVADGIAKYRPRYVQTWKNIRSAERRRGEAGCFLKGALTVLAISFVVWMVSVVFGLVVRTRHALPRAQMRDPATIGTSHDAPARMMNTAADRSQVVSGVPIVADQARDARARADFDAAFMRGEPFGVRMGMTIDEVGKNYEKDDDYVAGGTHVLVYIGGAVPIEHPDFVPSGYYARLHDSDHLFEVAGSIFKDTFAYDSFALRECYEEWVAHLTQMIGTPASDPIAAYDFSAPPEYVSVWSNSTGGRLPKTVCSVALYSVNVVDGVSMSVNGKKVPVGDKVLALGLSVLFSNSASCKP